MVHDSVAAGDVEPTSLQPSSPGPGTELCATPGSGLRENPTHESSGLADQSTCGRPEYGISAQGQHRATVQRLHVGNLDSVACFAL